MERFGKNFVKPFSKNYKKNNLYYGTTKVEVPKSVNIKHRIFGWIQAVLVDNSKVVATQRKWETLSNAERLIPVNLD